MHIGIRGEQITFDGKPTYSDFPNAKPEALGRLMNSRMVQATFEDENSDTAHFFTYPDGSPFDPNRQTNEFIAALPEYRRHGVIAVTTNFQGGYPRYHVRLRPDEWLQDWENNGFTPAGALKPGYAARMARVIEAADEQKMAVIVSFIYFGQNHKFVDENAIKRAVDEGTDFLLGLSRGNVMIEINNESNVGYVHEILQPDRVHELVARAKQRVDGRLLVSTSYGGGALPSEAMIEIGDYILLHGNGQGPDDIRRMVECVRSQTGKPIIFNEDSVSVDNMVAAWESGASWGYYDQGGQVKYHDGFQSPPTHWSINTPEKVAFFQGVAELVGIEIN